MCSFEIWPKLTTTTTHGLFLDRFVLKIDHFRHPKAVPIHAPENTAHARRFERGSYKQARFS